jgi:hypothetical protein
VAQPVQALTRPLQALTRPLQALRRLARCARGAGEMNAKACALNHCLKQLYPRKMAVPASEVVLVLDAHMSPVRQIFCKLLEVMQVGGGRAEQGSCSVCSA